MTNSTDPEMPGTSPVRIVQVSPVAIEAVEQAIDSINILQAFPHIQDSCLGLKVAVRTLLH